MNNSVLVIPHQIYPLRGTSIQTKRDLIILAKEVEQLGPAFVIMGHRLQGFSKAKMAEMANHLAALSGNKKIGRLPRRYRAAMICWFCNHVPRFMEPIQPIQPPSDNQDDPIPQPEVPDDKANDPQTTFTDWFEDEDPELAVDEQEYWGAF
jgi:hypothetical protein